jgi:hypothetical protein
MMRPNRFFEIVDDPSLFYFKGYNLFKLLYVPFMFRHSGRSGSAWRARPRWGFLWILKKSLYFVKFLAVAIYLGILNRRNPHVLFYGSTGRHIVIGDTTFDLYNARIVEQRGRHHFIIVEDSNNGGIKQYQPDLYLHDFASLIGLLCVASHIILGRDLREYAKTLAQRYPKLGFGEAEIVSKVLLFYGKFLAYRFLLTLLAPERVLLIAHYGKEAFIAACKYKNLQVIELMHGTIIPSHSQYVFPKSSRNLFHHSLFPDKLAVYGEYWKQVVVQGNMFPEDSVFVVGYYLKVPDEPRSLTSRDKITILVSAQPTVQCELYDYISFLKSQLDSEQWHIVIKPHPMEDSEAYSNLLQPGFITLSNSNVYELLARSDIHISVYSSVLYEAVRFDVSNYVLYVERVSMHCDEIINSGVALLLKPNEVPEPGREIDLDDQYYFAEFDPSVLFE